MAQIDDQQLGKPFTEYKNTLANILALASPAAGMMAFATDTGLMGMYNGSGWVWGWRETLTANRTYYVATTGDDANSGLAVGTPFLTIQKAINVAATLDTAGYTITIQVADGTYAGAVNLKNVVGFSAVGDLVIQGNASTPTNVILTGAGARIIASGLYSIWDIKDLRVTTSSGHGISVNKNSFLRFSGIDFGAVAIAHISCDTGFVNCIGNYTISGSAAYHYYIGNSGKTLVQGYTVTITGTPSFSAAFASSNYLGLLFNNGMTFSGSATGVRYSVTLNGVIFNGGGANYYPGDAAGSVATGGQYA